MLQKHGKYTFPFNHLNKNVTPIRLGQVQIVHVPFYPLGVFNITLRRFFLFTLTAHMMYSNNGLT